MIGIILLITLLIGLLALVVVLIYSRQSEVELTDRSVDLGDVLPIQTIYERAFEDVLKIWLYTEGPQDVLAFVKKKTGQKFNWHTRHNCDICRTIFTDKSILSILRDNVFEADSMPLLFYHCKAKTENERRTKQ